MNRSRSSSFGAMPAVDTRHRSTSLSHDISLADGSLADALPEWEEDAEAVTCRSCTQNFTMMRRRHHCRLCGQTFCGECSKERRSLPSYGLMEAVRVCNGCATLVDTAQAKGMMSMAIQLAQGNVTSLGELERTFVAPDAKLAAKAAVAVGCMDALLRAALCCGNDHRKLAAIVGSVAKMARQTQEVSSLSGCELTQLQVAESVQSRREWVNVVRDTLAASRNGVHLSASPGLALLSELVLSETTSITAWEIDSSNPWCEVICALMM